MPEQTKFINLLNPGEGYKLALASIDMPKVGEHDVLIHVAAAGVNRADLFQAEGKYNPPAGASSVLGLEVAGKIVAMGKNVRSHQLGDNVCALVSGGGYAEYIAVPEWRVLTAPKEMDVIAAAAIMEVWATAYFAMFEQLKLKPGEVLLIHGGASGVGTAAIQLARHFGIKTYITAGSAAKCARCKELGADFTIEHQKEDFEHVIKDNAQEKGVDAIIDIVGGRYIQKNVNLLKSHGRMVQLSFLEGSKAQLNLAKLVFKNLTLKGFTMRSQEEAVIYDILQSLRHTLWPLFEARKLKPVIDSVFPFSEAEKAHKYMKEGTHIGKIILSGFPT